MTPPLPIFPLFSPDTLSVGTLVTLPCAEVAEVLALCGFDWLWIDCEHAPLDALHVQHMVQAVAGRAACLARLPTSELVGISQMLDAGCDGVIVPQVRTAAQARAAVAACCYPPRGVRGMGLGRASGYGGDLARHLRVANDTVAVVLQLEHAEAIENCEDILGVPGVSAVVMGPYDLSGSLGHPGAVDHPDVVSAIESVLASAVRRRVPCGVFTATRAGFDVWRARGATVAAIGADVLFLSSAARAAIEGLDRKNSTEGLERGI